MGQQTIESQCIGSLTKIQQSRMRNLARSKTYRDSVALWGKPTELIRKRVMIAPGLATADGVSTTPSMKHTYTTKRTVAQPEEEDKFNYRSWIEQRKILREQFDECVISAKKHIDSGPMRRRKYNDNKPEVEPVKDIIEKDEVVKAFQPSLRPSINHPLPKRALGKICKFLSEKRMRIYDLFVRADRDKDWKITRDEFQRVLEDVGISSNSHELDQLLLALDENNDDALQYKELVQGLNQFSKIKLQKIHELSENVEPEEAADITEEAVVDQLPRKNSSLLSIPDTSKTDFRANMEEEKRLKKQKRKEKHRNKMKTPEVERQLCTMGEEIGPVIDKLHERSRREYEKVLELCHLHGVKLSRNLLERVLLYPEDCSRGVCISSLRSPGRHLTEEKLFRITEDESAPAQSLGNSSKVIRRKSSLFSRVYPPAASVRAKKERMSLSSGSADISRKTDCWMTYEQYRYLTRHLDSGFVKSWKASDPNAYWPSYVSDKVRLYLDKPARRARSENSIFEVVQNRTIH